jgi:hypothetical protein
VDAGEQLRLADAAADESARTALSWPLTCVGVPLGWLVCTYLPREKGARLRCGDPCARRLAS